MPRYSIGAPERESSYCTQTVIEEQRHVSETLPLDKIASYEYANWEKGHGRRL